MCIATKHITKIIEIYDDVITRYNTNQDIIKHSDNETIDLLHEIELSDSKNMYEGYLIYKEIRSVRERRRRAKDENIILEDLYNYFNINNNIRVQLQKIHNSSQKRFNGLNMRQYTPRERSDLTITNTKPESNKPFEELLKDFKRDQVLKGKHKYI